MASRRAPLASNPNVANSPLRGGSVGSALSGQGKPLKRPYAIVQREEPFDQPPPSKKQVLDNGAQRPVPTLASRSARPGQAAPGQVGGALQRTAVASRGDRAVAISRAQQDDSRQVYGAPQSIDIEMWRKHHRSRFPEMVFFFESIPEDVHAKLLHRIHRLGAKEEKFFSNKVTHLVTTRPIPPPTEQVQTREGSAQRQEHQHAVEQPPTINPSLLDRSAEDRRRMMMGLGTRRQAVLGQEDPARRLRSTRNTDVLCKARDMKKKIWSLDKFQKMLVSLLDDDASLTASYGARSNSTRNNSRAGEANLSQLLQREQLNGPSDRDPTADMRELIYFKGPHVYVYDMDEKQKPIMVREYPRVNVKTEGEWPQFRSVAQGRCPFIEEVDVVDNALAKAREDAKKSHSHRNVVTTTTTTTTTTMTTTPLARPSAVAAPARIETEKRALMEIADRNSKVRVGLRSTHLLQPSKTTSSVVRSVKFGPQNIFTGRPSTGRILAGEPVASGVQPSTVTSAIRSQMVSSTSGTAGTKAGTSREVHGLKRKVLQKSGTTTLRDAGSRRPMEPSLDLSSRPSTLGRATSRVLDVVEEDGTWDRKTSGHARAQSAPSRSKRDPKPGYCENCQDKFDDFDEHVLSRKHRRFAENNDNWVDLDLLLRSLKRHQKRSSARGDREVEVK